MVDLSVVIVSYNTRELLRDCLRSVFRSEDGGGSAERRGSTHWPFEVWVVDNASTDGSAEMVRQEFPQAKLIANGENRGFAAASNQAIEQCSGRYVLLLNPDTIVLDDALGSLVRFMDAHPRVGVAGARLVNRDGSFQHSAFRFPTLWMSLFDFYSPNHRITNSRLNGRYPVRDYDHPFPIDHPLGACLMVRRETIQQVGLLDERFFMYCEEVDWCLRIKRAGWEIYYVPEARVVHYVAKSTNQFREAMFLQLHKSRSLLFAKHYNAGFQWAARQIVRLGLLGEVARTLFRRWRGLISYQEAQQKLEAYRRVFWGRF
ncbi:MAG: glycosyltransferase family 2 protein [Chloroflexi bacterium]|nr:glycosyltransferase family 2 protein [Chloroflexota bacterium]